MSWRNKIVNAIRNALGLSVGKDFNNEPPVTDGSALTQQELMNAVISLNEGNNEAAESPNPFEPYSDYWQLLQISNYFANLYDVKSDNQSLLNNWAIIWQLCWLYGMAGVQVLGSGESAKLKVFAIHQLELNEYNEPVNVQGVLAKNWMNVANTAEIKPEGLLKLSQNINTDKFILLRANPQGLNAWITWKPFLTARSEMLKRLDHVSNLNMTKLVIEGISPNDAQAKKLLKSLKKPESAIFLYSLLDANGRLSASKLNLRTLDLKTQPIKEMTELVDWHTDYWYQLLGKRFNNSFKKERSLTAELSESQSNFDVLESYQKRECVRLFDFLKQHNIDADFNEEKENEMERMADTNNQNSNQTNSQQ